MSKHGPSLNPRMLKCVQNLASIYPDPENTMRSSLLRVFGKYSEYFLIILCSVVLREFILKVMLCSRVASQGDK